jgi:hypothetical protein
MQMAKKCKCEEAKRACVLLNKMKLLKGLAVICLKCDKIWGIYLGEGEEDGRKA